MQKEITLKSTKTIIMEAYKIEEKKRRELESQLFDPTANLEGLGAKDKLEKIISYVPETTDKLKSAVSVLEKVSKVDFVEITELLSSIESVKKELFDYYDLQLEAKDLVTMVNTKVVLEKELKEKLSSLEVSVFDKEQEVDKRVAEIETSLQKKYDKKNYELDYELQNKRKIKLNDLKFEIEQQKKDIADLAKNIDKEISEKKEDLNKLWGQYDENIELFDKEKESFEHEKGLFKVRLEKKYKNINEKEIEVLEAQYDSTLTIASNKNSLHEERICQLEQELLTSNRKLDEAYAKMESIAKSALQNSRPVYNQVEKDK